MHGKKFLNELDELNDKSTNVLNNFCSEEPQTSNQSRPVNKGAHGLVYFKEPPYTTAPPSAFILLKQKPKHEASMPHHGAIKEEQVKNQIRECIFWNILNDIDQDTIFRMYLCSRKCQITLKN